MHIIRHFPSILDSLTLRSNDDQGLHSTAVSALDEPCCARISQLWIVGHVGFHVMLLAIVHRFWALNALNEHAFQLHTIYYQTITRFTSMCVSVSTSTWISVFGALDCRDVIAKTCACCTGKSIFPRRLWVSVGKIYPSTAMFSICQGVLLNCEPRVESVH